MFPSSETQGQQEHINMLLGAVTGGGEKSKRARKIFGQEKSRTRGCFLNCPWVSEDVMHLSVSSPRGGRSGNPREFDCGIYPQGGDFDRTSCI